MSELIVYGAGCVWWDFISKASKNSHDLPCCPHCGSVLFQMEPKQWRERVEAYQQQTRDLSYKDFIQWLQGRCFKTLKEARACFDQYRETQQAANLYPATGLMANRAGRQKKAREDALKRLKHKRDDAKRKQRKQARVSRKRNRGAK